MTQGVPFQPETWPEDADGDRPHLCTVCGTPVRYGERHHDCGSRVMGQGSEAPQPRATPPEELRALLKEARSVIARIDAALAARAS